MATPEVKTVFKNKNKKLLEYFKFYVGLGNQEIGHDLQFY
jgi:hypothetical protein